MKPHIAIDIEQPDQLLAYLRESGRIGPGEAPVLKTLAGGVSNRTVLVERAGGEAWVVKQALARLRVAVEWFSSPERIYREAMGLRWLAELAPAGSTCRLVFEDREHHLIGMQAVPPPHDNWKSLLLAGRLETDHALQFGRLLGTIHRGAWERREEVAQAFDDRAFFESLRLEPYYGYTASQVPGSSRFLLALIEETRAARFTLTHGDYSPKNILVHGGRLVLLDHEVIHFGDPAFDLGFCFTHFLGKANRLPERRGDFCAAAAACWSAYREALGPVDWERGLEERAVRHTAACALARVAGRSPLEYLDAAARARQQRAALELMDRPARSVEDLLDRFAALLKAEGS